MKTFYTMSGGFVKRFLKDFVKFSENRQVFFGFVLRIGQIDTQRIIYVTMELTTNSRLSDVDR